MTITVNYQCGHDDTDVEVYVSEYSRAHYGSTEETKAAELVRAASTSNCRTCSQAASLRHEDGIITRNIAEDARIATLGAAPTSTMSLQCVGCPGRGTDGTPAEMSATLGPSCPECYDNLSN